MEVLRRCPLEIAQRLVHCAIALSTAVLDRVTKTMSVEPLLTNNLDNSKQKTSNLLSPAPPPYSWSLLGIAEGPAPPPSSKISWSFDLAWNPAALHPQAWTYIYRSLPVGTYRVQSPGFPKIVYSLPQDLKRCTTLSSFKAKLKPYLLNITELFLVQNSQQHCEQQQSKDRVKPIINTNTPNIDRTCVSWL